MHDYGNGPLTRAGKERTYGFKYVYENRIKGSDNYLSPAQDYVMKFETRLNRGIQKSIRGTY